LDNIIFIDIADFSLLKLQHGKNLRLDQQLTIKFQRYILQLSYKKQLRIK